MPNRIPNILIGDTTITPLKRLSNSKFTANLILRRSAKRTQSGKLYVQTLFNRYTVSITGISQQLYDDLRYEIERDEFIDLFSITNKKEFFNGTGSATVFNTSRRIRLDDANVAAVVEYPPGTILTSGYTPTNGSTQGIITFDSAPTSGTKNIIVRYFPILNGIIIELDNDYDYAADEESWALVFEES